MVGAVGLVEPGREHIVDPQSPRDRVDMEVERGGREQQPVSGLAIGGDLFECRWMQTPRDHLVGIAFGERRDLGAAKAFSDQETRSEEHTSELQSLMRTSYAVFC